VRHIPLPTPRWVQGFVIFLLAAGTGFGQQVTNVVFAARAQEAFIHAQNVFTAQPAISTNAWQLGRASYDWAEFATNDDQRAAIARTGIAACQQLVALDPKSAPGHYYLGMNYGELAEAEAPSMAAYRLIREIEHEFKTAADLDEHFDYAGPARCLGLLYRDAPGWPISIGSKHQAREYLEHALALEPRFPENCLNLVESQLGWRQQSETEAAWHHLKVIWPAAQTILTGRKWEPDWDDWVHRRAAVQVNFRTAFKDSLPPE
jgi:hypothetical protein